MNVDMFDQTPDGPRYTVQHTSNRFGHADYLVIDTTTGKDVDKYTTKVLAERTAAHLNAGKPSNPVVPRTRYGR